MEDPIQTEIAKTKAMLGEFGISLPKGEPRSEQFGAPAEPRRGRSQPGDHEIAEADGSDPRGALTIEQRRGLRRLARGEDPAGAAIREGVHPERVRRWLGTPGFKRGYIREMAEPRRTADVQYQLDRIARIMEDGDRDAE